MTHTDTYQTITNRIMELLEGGTIPWRKPWAAASTAPKNLASGKPYQGINTILLGCTPYQSPYWLSYNQARERGGHVRKGEQGWPITFWRFVEKDESDAEGKGYPILRQWTVFNVEQCEDIDYPKPEAHPAVDTIAAAEAIVLNMPNRPAIYHGGDKAFYRPYSDSVHMPAREHFESAAAYYSVLFHEMGHSTGHASRLNRPDIVNSFNFGSHTYSREELVAEMCAAMLCGVSGISPTTVENSAAYIQSWLRVLKGDKRLVIVAAGAAQKAADHIRGVSAQEKDGDDDTL